MKRVVVTGRGIVSCLGNDVVTVLGALRQGRSGLRENAGYREAGLRSQVSGHVAVDRESVDRKARRFMGDAAIFACLAMQQAIAEAGLTAADVRHPRTGLIMGTGGASPANIVAAADTLRQRGIRRLSAYLVPRAMSSTVAANLATAFQIRGTSYSLSSACATSAHCIGHALERIQEGREDVVFAGGGEEEHWSLAMLFDAMGALSTRYNATPAQASRPYDARRDGFVIAGGGGVLVLEELEHAQRRGARIYAEVVGYGATSDGAEMATPSGEGAVRCMRRALASIKRPVDYLNTHGTGTPLGDLKELDAIQEAFGGAVPHLSSTKALSGHALGAAGVHEAIYCLLMLEHDFIAASANIEELDAHARHLPIATARRDHAGLQTVMSNNFGFGGANASLIFQRYDAP